jgi:hypothetical protein
MARLAGLLARIPEVGDVPVPSRRPGGRSARGSFLPAAAAALVAAAAGLLGIPLFEERPILEGPFRAGPGRAFEAEGASSAVVLAGHRLRLRKGTRVRLDGPAAVFLEEGRLDGRGLREGARLRVGTPLGRVDVLGTEFVVEVTPVKATPVALAGSGFVVGVLVSSGVVSYAEREHRVRLEAGQGVVAQSGKDPRRVTRGELERRARSAALAERDLELQLAALGAENRKLGEDAAALESGRPRPARPALAPAERRERFRQLARSMLGSMLLGVRRETRPPAAEPPAAETLEETVEVGEEETRNLADALAAANDLGVSIFDRSALLKHSEFVEETLMAVLESKSAALSSARALVEAAVRRSYDSVQGPWETKPEERLAYARALERALRDLEGQVPADRLEDLYDACAPLAAGSFAPMLAYGKPEDAGKSLAERLSRPLGLDDSQKAVVSTSFDDWLTRVRTLTVAEATARGSFGYSLSCRELEAELARRLVTLFPDRKDRIEAALMSW